MVLGRLRTRKQKAGSVSVDYLIHVKQINPWQLSQKSAEFVLLQWESSNKSSGYLTSSVLDGKIEFSESFKLPITLTKETSKKNTTSEGFQKNFLEFYLYESRKDKATKGHLLGSSIINLADYGVIEETIAISAPINLKKSSKNMMQPVLYVSMQPFEKDSSSSSPKANLSKEVSLDNEENDEEEIADFTDDDDDGVSVQSSQTTSSSTFETTTLPNDKKRPESVKDSRETVNVEPALPSRAALASLEENAVAEPFKYQNNSEVQNRTEPEKDSKITEYMDSGAAFSKSEQNPVVEQDKYQNKNKEQNRMELVKHSTEPVNTEPALPSRVAFDNLDKNPVNEPVRNRIKSEKDSTETVNMDPSVPSGAAFANSNENSVVESFEFQNKNKVQNGAESARDGTDTIFVEPPPRSGAAFPNVDKTPVDEPFEYQNNSSFPSSSVDLTSFRKIAERRKKAADSSAGVRLTTQQSKWDNVIGGLAAKGASSESQIILEDDTRSGRQSKDRQEKTITSSSPSDLPENKKKMDMQKHGPEKQEMDGKAHCPEDETLSELSHSTRKEVGFRSKTLTSSRNGDQGSFVPNDKLKHVKSHQLPSDSVKSNGLSRNKEIRVRAKENDISEDSRNGSKSPITGTKGTKNDYSGSKVEMKSKIEMLEEELREAAAVEVALYSVVAEHGNSANKVHAPARRLSRFYFHALKAGSRSKMASAARTSISGLILVSRACGNDVPRLTFWLSNSIVLRATISQASGNLSGSAGSDIINDKFTPRGHESVHDREKNNVMENFEDWDNILTFISALEKVEAWIFSRIVESVWWQTLTPHMQSSAAKSSSSRKTHGKKHGFGDAEQVNFSIDLWKKAFKDACERLCPLRAGGLECGCLPILARLVMEQLVNRLDVAMFNAILRDSAEDMPTDPMSDPISDSKVLPVPAGKTSFGAGAHLKNSVGNWSRWLTDLFGIDDDPPEDNGEPNVDKTPESGTSFKPFDLLKSLGDLLMIPFDNVPDESTRKEICPAFGAPLIKRIFINFVPDEFCPTPVPQALFESLDSLSLSEAGEDYITSVPCSAAPTVYSPPKAASLIGIIGGEVGTHSPSLARGPSLLRKSYTSDDELDELDSPMKSISIDSIRINPSSPTPNSKAKGRRKAVRYQLLREVWRDEK